MLSIDVNCDLGEGMPGEDLLMSHVSSVNIACGYHAGDALTMEQTIRMALQHNVAIGAHPGFDDKQNFGRAEIWLTDKGYYDLVFTQLEILQQQLLKQGASMQHVKPHGALYNMSAGNERIAAIIAAAVKDFDDRLILYGLSNSHSVKAAEKAGLRTAAEVFADRTYTADGSLTPRTQHGAVITDVQTMQRHVLQMVLQQAVTTTDGSLVPVKAQTICVHGDGDHAVAFAQAINSYLQQNGLAIRCL
ncbi:LamB/YcsF family protein [Panacibacter sp. DH6]|uniref:LamB/YcsF family protein n=1 Tax=Panacibacter microcysteis TaxID=2793269 RepID=A0A931H0B1_9BACT|nr:5-oxoprolinase subunit PxpA [Panacibacter microcysteis]MBG9378643.1 LamB/YcsF family protein [Panacibacter microcysteis]